MNPFLKPLALLGLAGLIPAQGGLRHEVGWLPEPNGAYLATEFADMNQDGVQDLVRLRHNAVEVLLQNPSTGRFVRVSSLSLGATTALDLRAMAIGHLDSSGDSLPDVAVVWSNGGVDVLRNNAGGSLSRIVPRPVPPMPPATGVDIFAADLDGNLIDDLLVLLEATPPQYIQAQAPGTFLNITSTSVPAAVAYPRPRATLADTDGDLDLDLILCSTNPLPPTLLENQGGNFVVQPGAFGGGGMSVGQVIAIDLAGSPLPELVFARPGTASNMPTVLMNFGGSFSSAAVTQQLRLRGALDIARVDVDRDGVLDLVFLEATGRLGYALRGNNGTLIGHPTGVANTTEPMQLLGPDPSRVCFAAADLEGDGDVDLAAGGEGPDSLLLHGPGADFYDAERLAFPGSRRPIDYAAVLVDRDINDDVDFVGLLPTGEWLALDNDGGGYFRDFPGPVAALLPSLPPATVWRQVAKLSLSPGTPGRNDLVAFGNGSGVSGPIAILRNAGGFWVDETAIRFGGPVTSPFVPAMAVYGNGGQADHLILGTSAGQLEFHENVGGQFVYQPGLFPAGLNLFSLSQLIVADFSRDGLPDVLALQTTGPPRLLLASASGFTLAPSAVPVSVSGDHGIAANLDGDGDLDLLLRTTGQPGITALSWNHSVGAFLAVALGPVSAANFRVTDMAVVRVDGTQRVVFARDDGLDVLFAWNGAGYSGPVPMSYRGTSATRGLLTADVDRDGDLDVLALRSGFDPVVLSNETLHLQALGPLQSGRSGQVLVGAPEPGSLAFISYGLPLNTVTPWGLLRLNPATMGTIFLGVAPASRHNIWNLSLGFGLPRIRFPIQAAWITPSNQIVLSGLDHLVITP